MKKQHLLLLVVALCCAGISRLAGQSTEWQSGSTANAKIAAVQQTMADLFGQLNAGDMDKASTFYTSQSALLSIDGSISFDKNATMEGWKAQLKMLDELPKFSYENLKVRMLGTDVALVVYEVELRYKYQGNVTVSKAIATDVLHKTDGKWLIELEQMTPIPATSEH